MCCTGVCTYCNQTNTHSYRLMYFAARWRSWRTRTSARSRACSPATRPTRTPGTSSERPSLTGCANQCTKNWVSRKRGPMRDRSATRRSVTLYTCGRGVIHLRLILTSTETVNNVFLVQISVKQVSCCFYALSCQSRA